MSIVFISLLTFLCTACNRTVHEAAYLDVSPETIFYDAHSPEANAITVSSNVPWTATPSDSSLSIDAEYGTSGKFTVLITGMRAGDSQTIEFETTAGSHITRTVTVRSAPAAMPAASWAELPARVDNPDYLYTTHTALLDGAEVRNYTLCFDKTKRAAIWVAYPLHDCYFSNSVGRTDDWGYDPQIEESVQADVVRRSYVGKYDRGHQIPSADRLATAELNRQTFYMSNMTPQPSSFNQGIWASLENMVRNRFVCSDTLYVVTGARWNSAPDFSADNDGVECPIPSEYYKVLLRTKSGDSGKAVWQCCDDELETIGFWIAVDASGKVTSRYCKSVAEIEKLTGIEFFPNVAPVVKESFDAAQWGL